MADPRDRNDVHERLSEPIHWTVIVFVLAVVGGAGVSLAAILHGLAAVIRAFA